MTKYLWWLDPGDWYKDVYYFILSTSLIFKILHNEKLGNENKGVRLDMNPDSSIYYVWALSQWHKPFETLFSSLLNGDNNSAYLIWMLQRWSKIIYLIPLIQCLIHKCFSELALSTNSNNTEEYNVASFSIGFFLGQRLASQSTSKSLWRLSVFCLPLFSLWPE